MNVTARQLGIDTSDNLPTLHQCMVTCQKLVYIDTIWGGDPGNNVFVRELAHLCIGEWNDVTAYNLLRV